MLLRFGVSNYRSIRDYVELSLIASDAIKDKGTDLLELPGAKYRVLPAIVIYGANAAGKSTIHMALGAMGGHVVNSFRKLEAGAPIPQHPFALDKASKDEPTHFDCDFIIDGVRYHYGFEFNEKEFEREWLYSFPEGYRRVLFNRDSANGEIEFGKHLRGKNRAIEELMRPNSLFVSVAAQSSHEELKKIYDFFRQSTNGVGASLNDANVQKSIGSTNDPRLVPFLQTADTGIAGLEIREESQPEEAKKILSVLRNTLASELGEEAGGAIFDEDTSRSAIFFKHLGEDGELFELPFSRESRGTKRLSKVVLSAYKALDNGSVLFIDEIDTSLHTLLSMKLVSLFANKATNPHGAQLVATTHDTNLLCCGVIRRDQIWFAEKAADGGTQLYPLTDIKTRNTDNLEKGYLQGRFGAIPYFGDVTALFGAVDNG
ncbi:MAG: ATP-binding protein [Pseudomonadota bacterium]